MSTYRNHFTSTKEPSPRNKLHPLQMLWFAVLLAGCTIAPVQALPRPQVPDTLNVGADEHMTLALDAEGVQIYQCQPTANDATKYEWAFRAPEAILYDSAHNEVGTHYGGPTWASNDGSLVIGEVVARADAPDADAVPWLLLKAKAVQGPGVFADVTSIQRVETSGGKAPAIGCDAEHNGEEARIPYTAVYYFHAAK